MELSLARKTNILNMAILDFIAVGGPITTRTLKAELFDKQLATLATPIEFTSTLQKLAHSGDISAAETPAGDAVVLDLTARGRIRLPMLKSMRQSL